MTQETNTQQPIESDSMSGETDNNSQWQLIQANTLREVHNQVLETFSNTYHEAFEDEWMGVNHKLKVELRGLKFVDGWVTGFLLTPWMLCSIYIPVMQAPDLEIDEAWKADNRTDKSYLVIGPLKNFEIAAKPQKANLNYDTKLGHYLLQPLVQLMDKYADNEEAFGAWSEVIEFRKAHYEKLEQDRVKLEEEIENRSSENDDNQTVNRRTFLAKWV